MHENSKVVKLMHINIFMYNLLNSYRIPCYKFRMTKSRTTLTLSQNFLVPWLIAFYYFGSNMLLTKLIYRLKSGVRYVKMQYMFEPKWLRRCSHWTFVVEPQSEDIVDHENSATLFVENLFFYPIAFAFVFVSQCERPFF